MGTFLRILLILAFASCGFSGQFPIYGETPTPYDQVEKAIFSDDLTKVQELIKTLSPSDQGSSLVCAIFFHRQKMAQTIFQLAKDTISKDILKEILSAEVVSSIQLGNPQLLTDINKDLKENFEFSNDNYFPGDIAQHFLDSEPRILQWVIQYLLTNPTESNVFAELNLDKVQQDFLEGKYAPTKLHPAIFLASLASLKASTYGAGIRLVKELLQNSKDLLSESNQALFKENLDSIFSHSPFDNDKTSPEGQRLHKIKEKETKLAFELAFERDLPHRTLEHLQQHPETFLTFPIDISGLEKLERDFMHGKFSTLPDLEDFLASLLSLKYMTKDGVMTALKQMKLENKKLFEKLDERKFEAKLSSIFSSPPFNTHGSRFEAKRWKGRVKRDRRREEFPKGSRPDLSQKETKSLDVMVLGNNRRITYDLYKNKGDPEYIVVSVYPGYHKGFLGSCSFEPNLFPKEQVWSIALNLWDCDSTVHQVNQLDTEDSIRKTHASYLYATSEFIRHIKVQYPKAKIILEGGSFGGFFVTSYAFLQSIFGQSLDMGTIYQTKAVDAFRDLFPTHKIEPVSGIISFAGSLYYMKRLLLDQVFLKEFRVPGLFAYNHDDDRVLLEEVTPILSALPLKFCEIFLIRERAGFYGEDFRGNLHNIESTTIRGHFRPTIDSHDDTELVEASLDFMSRIHDGKLQQSSIGQEVQKRRRTLYLKDSSKSLQSFVSNGEDIPDNILQIAIALTLIEMSLDAQHPIRPLFDKHWLNAGEKSMEEEYLKRLTNITHASEMGLRTLRTISDKKRVIEDCYESLRKKLDDSKKIENKLILDKFLSLAGNGGDHIGNKEDKIEMMRSLKSIFVNAQELFFYWHQHVAEDFLRDIRRTSSFETQYDMLLNSNKRLLMQQEVFNPTTSRKIWAASIERVLKNNKESAGKRVHS